MRKILLSIIALCISCATFASRPLKGLRTHVQSDGKTISVRPTGNSISGFYVTTDDYALYSVGSDYFYAYLDAEGNFKNSGILAHNKEERTEAENELLKGSEYQNVASRFEYEPETYRLPQSKATRAVGSTDLATIKCTGSPKVLVVLVDFSDVQFCIKEVSEMEPVDYYDLALNGTNASEVYSKTNNIASVQKYFTDQSLGQFTPVFDVYSKIYRANNASTYYGKDEETSKDINIRKLRDEIGAYLKNEPIDLAPYDANKDGEVDCLIVIYAGKSQATGGGANTIWNKCISTKNDISTCGTYNLCTTVFVNERYVDDSHTFLEGIGTMCHEFSHALGLPDMYYTLSTVYFGLNHWSLMDEGLYYWDKNNKIYGTKPVGYTAYEKEFMGWITIEELTEGYHEFKNLKSVADGGKAYRITNPANTNEYLILESRQTDGWGLYRGGLQIMKVKYDYSIWKANRVNSYSEQRCTLIPADGKLDIKDGLTDDQYWASLYGDLFPIEASEDFTAVTEFVPTDKSLFYYNFPIRNITRDKTTKTVSFTIGNNPTGVDAVNAAALVDVYSASGIRLRKDVEAGTATDNLPEGIYIVGGKKVIKR